VPGSVRQTIVPRSAGPSSAPVCALGHLPPRGRLKGCAKKPSPLGPIPPVRGNGRRPKGVGGWHGEAVTEEGPPVPSQGQASFGKEVARRRRDGGLCFAKRNVRSKQEKARLIYSVHFGFAKIQSSVSFADSSFPKEPCPLRRGRGSCRKSPLSQKNTAHRRCFCVTIRSPGR